MTLTATLMLLSLLLAIALAACAWLWQRLRGLEQRLVEHGRERVADVRNERLSAASEERARLLADLHDDIGAKLMTLVHAVEQPELADLARAVVQDFRDVVSRSNQDPCSLLQALGQIREETEHRLDSAGSVLDWQQHADLPDPMLDEAQVLHLFRISREAVTNALRHGHATHIRIRARAVGRSLLLDLTDNGPGFAAQAHAGRGTVSMRSRAQQLAGTIDWTAGTIGGTKVVLEFPLPV
jgi:signal transduction histidine kinase